MAADEIWDSFEPCKDYQNALKSMNAWDIGWIGVGAAAADAQVQSIGKALWFFEMPNERHTNPACYLSARLIHRIRIDVEMVACERNRTNNWPTRDEQRQKGSGISRFVCEIWDTERDVIGFDAFAHKLFQDNSKAEKMWRAKKWNKKKRCNKPNNTERNWNDFCKTVDKIYDFSLVCNAVISADVVVYFSAFFSCGVCANRCLLFCTDRCAKALSFEASHWYCINFVRRVHVFRLS